MSPAKRFLSHAQHTRRRREPDGFGWTRPLGCGDDDTAPPHARVSPGLTDDDGPIEKWPRTTKSRPCPICGGTRCQIAPSGRRAYCRRQDRHEWLDHPVTQPPRTRHDRPDNVADDATLDRVYRSLLGALPLTPEHGTALVARGLEPGKDPLGPRSVPPEGSGALRETATWAFQGARIAAGDATGRVPLVRDGIARCPAGLVIPVVSLEGQVVGLRVRPDDPGEGGKYRWGVGARARVHVARPPVSPAVRVWITEGELKAEVAARRLGAVVLSLPGVSVCHSEAEAIVVKLAPPGSEVVIAFDADADRKPQVALARAQLAARLLASGLRVQFATWPEAQGKGLDDLLVAGGVPALVPCTDFARPKGDPPGAVSAGPRGPEPRFANYFERWFLLAASRHAPDRTAANAFLSAALCGLLKERGECSIHETIESEHMCVCERPACPHFALAHARDQLTIVSQRWPKEVAIGLLTSEPSAAPGTVAAGRIRVRKAIRKLATESARARGLPVTERRREARAAISRLGFYVAPGGLCVVSCDPDDVGLLRRVPGLEGTERAGRRRQHELLERVFYARARRLLGHLGKIQHWPKGLSWEDGARAFGGDPWINRVVTPTGGAAFRVKCAWPNMSELREEASHKSDPESRGKPGTSKCCGAPLRYVLVHVPTGQVYTSRLGRPYSFTEAIRTVLETERANLRDREGPDPEEGV